MDASLIELTNNLAAREPSRKGPAPAPGFERHLAGERKRTAEAPPAPALRARPERMAGAEGVGCEQAACPVVDEAPSEPAAADNPQNVAGNEEVEGAEAMVESIIVAAVLPPVAIEPALLEVSLVEAVNPVAPAESVGISDLRSQIADVEQVLPPELMSELAEEATPDAIAMAELKSPLVTSEPPPETETIASRQTSDEPLLDEEPKPVEMTPAAVARPEAKQVETPRARKGGPRPDSADEPAAEVAATPENIETAALAIEADAVESATSSPDSSPKPPKPEANSGASAVPHGTPRGIEASPPPSSSRLPSHLVSRGGERAEQAPRVHDAEQVRLLQRVARAFETAQARDGELRLRLSPPELGSLKLEIKVQEGVMTARMEAETPEARAILLDNLAGLRERLAEQNMKIDRFEVDLLDRQLQGQTQDNRQDADRPAASHRPAIRRESESTAGVTGANGHQPLVLQPGKLNVVV